MKKVIKQQVLDDFARMKKVTKEQALEALDCLDDFTRTEFRSDAIGPRLILERYIKAPPIVPADFDVWLSKNRPDDNYDGMYIAGFNVGAKQLWDSVAAECMKDG